MKFRSWIIRGFLAAALTVAPQLVLAETALVAVAANFFEVIEVLKSDFEASHDHELTIVTGSTGKLYAQIVNGAPFDVLLAADQTRPELLVSGGYAQTNSRFTYATGQIVLWSADASRIGDNGLDALNQPFRRLAIANPQLAPYGIAAEEALSALGLLGTLRSRIVMGENIGQTHTLVASGNAELGIVALAYAKSPRNTVAGSYWQFPSDLYSPIHQDAVLITRAKDNTAARTFMTYIQSDVAKETIRAHGYVVE